MTPPILASAGRLLERYDVLFCDIWGVVHNGVAAYPAAGEALAGYRRAGGTVVLLSNAPRGADAVACILDEKGVVRDAWDVIVTSGDLARSHIAERGYRRVHHIGPRRDDDLFAAISAQRTGFDEAEALVVTGLNDDRRETGESYRALLTAAVARGMPLVCANPDLVVHVGSLELPCAGAVAAIHAALGGAVYWAGKPHRPVYERALVAACEARGADIAPGRVLAIGDAVRTDLAGAAGFGIDALFIAQGIHHGDVMVDGGIRPERLTALLAAHALPAPVAVMVALQ